MGFRNDRRIVNSYDTFRRNFNDKYCGGDLYESALRGSRDRVESEKKSEISLRRFNLNNLLNSKKISEEQAEAIKKYNQDLKS